MREDAKIIDDRAGDTYAEKFVSANSPAILRSVDRDIARLEDQGIDCSPHLAAEYALSSVTIHRLLAYSWFVKRHAHLDKPNIKEIWDVLTFDRRIQSTLLKYIGIFESRFRSIYSRLMSEHGGIFALYDDENFLRRPAYEDTWRKYTSELMRQKRNGAVRRQLEEHGQKVPIGVAVEYLTLGTLSKFYSNTKSHDVAAACASEFNINKKKMASWLKTLTTVRNCCAHFNPYVVRKQIPSTPLPVKGEEAISRHPLYAAVMLERLLYHDGVDCIHDTNLNFTKRLRIDMLKHVGQFLALFDFSDDVADDLGIPLRYLPRRASSDGQEGVVVYETKEVFIPNSRNDPQS